MTRSEKNREFSQLYKLFLLLEVEERRDEKYDATILLKLRPLACIITTRRLCFYSLSYIHLYLYFKMAFFEILLRNEICIILFIRVSLGAWPLLCFENQVYNVFAIT